MRILGEAERLFKLAGFVHDRAEMAGDSASLAYRALLELLRLIVLVQGERPPPDTEALSARAKEVATQEGFWEPDFTDDVGVIRDMQKRFWDLGNGPTNADNRRYDRAFVRISGLFGEVRDHVEGTLPSDDAGPRKYWKMGLGLGAALLVGLFIGMRLRPAAPPAPAVLPALPAPSGVAPVPTVGFSATYFSDEQLSNAVATRIEPTIAFDWGADAPPGTSQPDHFSARWTGRLNVTEGKNYDFFLTSDDGSRLFIDDKLVIDNWGSHSEVTLQAEVELQPGIHPVRVEYFDGTGSALVHLDWSADEMARRAVRAEDLR
jgi:hypothetical protein